ncbi:MAG: hypothetical protein V3R96_08480 [Dehalococcoidales bacterium]
MKFKPTPIDFDVELPLQSDQTDPLRDIAEWSDEVGIESQYQLRVLYSHDQALLMILFPQTTAMSTVRCGGARK